MNKLIPLVIASLFALGCGAAGGTTYSCDNPSGASGRGCVEYSWTGSGYTAANWSAACTSGGGTSGTGCSHTGALGGCRLTASAGNTSLTTTTWFYTGTAADLQQACTAGTGTWVNP